MLRLIWMIAFIATLLGGVTMLIPNKVAYIVTWIMFIITILGVTFLLTFIFFVMFGGTIEL